MNFLAIDWQLPIIGVLLSILGLVLFGFSDPERQRITALIPTFFGVVLLALIFTARNPKLRMHAMHGVALVALIGTIVPLIRAVPALAAGGDLNLPITGQIIMAVLCAKVLFLCVKSFIAARRARKAPPFAKGGPVG